MYPSVFLYFLSTFLSFLGYSQTIPKKPYHHAIQLTSENDNYLWPYHDRYYTNGLHIGFSYLPQERWWLPGKAEVSEFRKTILHFKLAHEIYTPDNLKENDITALDRPYAGYLYFRSAIHTFWHRSSNLQLALDAGVVGPWAGGGTLQRWWHKLINYTLPQGWHHQIRNEGVVNFQASFQKAWQVFSWADILTSSRAQTGTAFNNLSLGLTARMGKINPVDNSAMTNSRLNPAHFQKVINQDHSHEWFAFCSIEGTKVFHNTLIEGSLFQRRTSVHTENINPYLWTQKMGMVYSTSQTTMKITMYFLTPEVRGGKNHQFLHINLGVRF